MKASGFLRRGRGQRWARAAALLCAAVLLAGTSGCIPFIPFPFRRPPVVPQLPPGAIIQSQLYVVKVSSLDLQVIAPDGQTQRGREEEYVDYVPGTLLRTGQATGGHIFLGLPGRAELFLAPDTEARLISADHTGNVIQLVEGYSVLNLPDEFPAGRRVTVLSSSGARTWVSGSSKMCLRAEPSRDFFRMECVEGRCGYYDGTEKEVEAGYQVDFVSRVVTSVGRGVEAEACQFLPGGDATSTPGVTATAAPGRK